MQSSLPPRIKTAWYISVPVILLLIPSLIFIVSLQTIQSRDKVWYGGGYDPEYAYLFNALNVANCRLVGHYDHPGTPMQVYGAAVLQTSRLFINYGNGLTRDVLSHPEAYLRILNTATAALGTMFLFIAGFILWRRTSNIWYALALQLVPFISGFVLFNAFTRFTQEAALMMASVAMAAATIDWLINSNSGKESGYAKTFGIIGGFGMASKFLFAPLLLIPFLLLSNFKSRIKYLLFTAGAFVVFTLPIIPLYPNMAMWVLRLFLYTGQYGSGNAGVLDTLTYPHNLLWTFKVNPVLLILTAFGLLWLLSQLIKNKAGNLWRHSKSFRLTVAVVAAVMAGYLVIAKQPKEAYLLPYEMIASVFFILILFEMGRLKVKSSIRSMIQAFALLALVIILIPLGLKGKQQIYSIDKNHIWESSWLAMKAGSENSILLFTHPASSPIDALFFGNAYSHSRYTEILNQLYPDTYLYKAAENRIVNFDHSPIVPGLLAGKKRILIQCPAGFDLTPVLPVDPLGFVLQNEPLYKNDKQEIWVAFPKSTDDSALKQVMIFSSAEAKREPGRFGYKMPQNVISSDQGIRLTGSIDYSEARTGLNSIVTHPGSPYAFTTQDISLHPGDEVEAQVYAMGNQPKSNLVVSESKTNRVLGYSASQSGENKGWVRHYMHFKNSTDSIANIFVYGLNSSSNDTVWFDDFSVNISHYGKH